MLSDHDVRDTAILKGLAITAIVLHNFFHFVSPAQENEFTFDQARFRLFLESVHQPPLAIQAIFSFFGHFGVQIFIFLSAYGLAKSYWDGLPRWTTFMAGRIRKLFPKFGLIVLPWFITFTISVGLFPATKRVGLELVLMFAGLSPLLPGYGLPPVGPWWFIPFIIQCYAIWPFLRRLTLRFGWPGLAVLSIVCVAFARAADPMLAHWSVNLFLTPVGNMPVLCFGIVAARYPFRIDAPIAFSACAILMLGLVYVAIWPATFIAALLLALWLYRKTRERLRRCPLLERIGHYSCFIFLLNGIVRNEIVPFARSPASQLIFAFVNALLSFAIAALIHEFLLPGERSGEPRLSRGRVADTSFSSRAGNEQISPSSIGPRPLVQIRSGTH
jgi:peptidoglycan/LPS O-acetylase OafA/YrhL